MLTGYADDFVKSILSFKPRRVNDDSYFDPGHRMIYNAVRRSAKQALLPEMETGSIRRLDDVY